MSNRKRIGMMLLVAMLGFSCTPTFSLASAPTLDPFSMSTAIAQTADAASAQTAAAAPQPAMQASPVPGGPLLDQDAFNTSIAQTFEAAGTQTAALIPNTLTPTPTSLPTQTAINTPSPTSTFLLTIHTATPFKLPKPTATKKPHKGGKRKGEDDDDGVVLVPKAYSCSVVGVNPPSNTVIHAGANFTVYWTVMNTASPWDVNSVDLIYGGGDIPVRGLGYDMLVSVGTGSVVTLPGAELKAPSKAGSYTSRWQLVRGDRGICTLYITIIVGAPTPTSLPTIIVSPPP